MKESFEELYRILQLDRKVSPWSKNRTINERITELNKEIVEVNQAIEKKDLQNLHEELGDTLWSVLSVIIIAEERYDAKTKDIIDNVITKIKYRKPWIFNGEKMTEEDEATQWIVAKKQEKEK